MVTDSNDDIDDLLTAREKGFPLSSSVVIGLFVLLDGLWIAATGWSSFYYYVGGNILNAEPYPAAVCFIWIVSLFLFHYGGLYDFNAIMSPFGNMYRIAVAIGTSFMLLLAVAFSMKVSDEFSRVWMFTYGASAFAAIFSTRLAGFFLISHLANIGVFARNVLIVGGGKQAEQLIAQMAKERPRFNHVAGIFDDRLERIGPTVGRAPVLGNLDSLIDYVRNNRVDDIVVTLPWNADERLVDIISKLRVLPADIHLGSDLVGFRFPYRPSQNHFSGVPMMEVVKMPLTGWNIALKALEDKILGVLLLIVFSPILAAVAVAIRLESKGPILFRQKRYGFNNQIFDIYKFRSMYHDRPPEQETVQATRDDPRITKVGNFIRRTSLDELPQLLNVVEGTMSLVGPRPHAVDHNKEYGAVILGYFARHRVKPGITGWAQVNGLRGETDTLEKMEARVRYDTYYAENWSLLFDLQILARTAFVGFINKNAY